MSELDLSPVAVLRLAKGFIRAAVAVLIIGGVAWLLVATSSTEGTEATTRDNVLFGLIFCFGPALLVAVLLYIVGRLMRRSVRDSDPGSMYRGWD